MKLRVAKKIFATSVGVSVGLPGGGKTWIGESLTHRHFLLMRALRRLAKVRSEQRFKFLGPPRFDWK